MGIVVVVGMEAEAEIVRQTCPMALVVVGAGDAELLRSRLEAAIAAGADRVISVGICGALEPSWGVGDVVVGINALYDEAVVPCDRAWRNRLLDALQADPQRYIVRYGQFAWSETAVARLTDKASLRAATNADAVDEETFIAGAIAAAKGLPFAAFRVVSDAADFELPPAALVKLTAAGALDIGAILAAIAGDLFQIPELVELAGSTATALGNLRAALARVGGDLAA